MTDEPVSDIAIERELLAWAKQKVKDPLEWCNSYIQCSFCGQRQVLLWRGGIDPYHTDTCLAVRANTEPPK